ncbi:hypothetical protein PILCRDRAFT_816127 [Piloderma croceum F 1598]|uniref:Uncharacterized protein n=1 Tax=Piloderma croceum (strain F 1598) TaxID=765440 RepID=A0A0C3FQ04_PILCF|nr:hypothetical protein PILCRDRAFT_816127 [Piloderma croceum F 1598]
MSMKSISSSTRQRSIRLSRKGPGSRLVVSCNVDKWGRQSGGLVLGLDVLAAADKEQ